MPIDMTALRVGESYSRHELAKQWGYKSFQALARGVVTPAADNKIVLFITRDKQESAEQYKNDLLGDLLHWQGPTDHFAESRIMNAPLQGDEIHAFYREKHHTDFTYLGRVEVAQSTLTTDGPSSFICRLPNT